MYAFFEQTRIVSGNVNMTSRSTSCWTATLVWRWSHLVFVMCFSEEDYSRLSKSSNLKEELVESLGDDFWLKQDLRPGESGKSSNATAMKVSIRKNEWPLFNSITWSGEFWLCSGYFITYYRQTDAKKFDSLLDTSMRSLQKFLSI